MLQISADLSSLSLSQRQAIASFILNFPSELSESPELEEDEQPANIPAFAIIPEQAFELTDGPTLATNVAPAPTPLPFVNPTIAVQSVSAAATILPSNITTIAPSANNNGLDSSGLPWDERIHSGNRAKVADGTWRKRRGVNDAEVATVEAQLKQLMALPSPTAAVPAPPPPPAPTDVPAPPPPAAALSVVPDRTAYLDLVEKGSKALAEKKLTQEELTYFVNSAGAPSLAALIHRMDLVPQVMASISTLIASRA